ncbi:tight junction protein ZO-1 [Galendromus occidentalis]|uniref:Tight junction protein ZO-1 n=1 Tax=Galendromus occidentalis TaxID=34638 RepID=A0AAJ7SHN0_9ACAR|nr:tight junction protein ZO-1 [Galendromus occidentalis]
MFGEVIKADLDPFSVKRKPTEAECAQDSNMNDLHSCYELLNIPLAKVPNYGFGIAVSGGRDSSLADNQEGYIVISDVLKNGPAEGKLLIGDIVLSANGVSFENVDYSRAVNVLRESEAMVNLLIKRRLNPDCVSGAQNMLSVQLQRSKKKEDFGIVLGCQVYIKEITPRSIAHQDNTLKIGDIVLKINDQATDNLSLKDARKLLDSVKNSINLVVKRDASAVTNGIENRAPNLVPESLYSSGNGPPSGLGSPMNNLCFNGTSTPTKIPKAARALAISEGVEELSRRTPPVQLATKPSDAPVRTISFEKPPEGSLGIRLTGGNKVGIFVSAVQPGIAASLQGLQPGDKLLKVNQVDMNGVTREDAVMFLLRVQEHICLEVQHCKEEYDDIVANHLHGDSFYVKTQFVHEPPPGQSVKDALSFKSGEIFHVVDTLHNGSVGQWLVYRLGRNNQEIQKGVIPNASRADEHAHEQMAQLKKDKDMDSRGSFFKRRGQRRSKSLIKDYSAEPIYSDQCRLVAYQRVTLKHPGFVRPVVIFGAIADVARNKLLHDYRDIYASPRLAANVEDLPGASSGVIRLSAIKDISKEGKHAVLDVTPSAVDRLNYAQFYPIVIFLRAENKHVVKEVRGHFAPVLTSRTKSSRKLLEHASRIEKSYSHAFCCTIPVTAGSVDSWYRKLVETIDRQQLQAIWIAEGKPDSLITDDFLFPSQSNRLSYASSPESDVELVNDNLPEESYTTGRLVKSSSDPSLVLNNEIQSVTTEQGPQEDHFGNLAMQSGKSPAHLSMHMHSTPNGMAPNNLPDETYASPPLVAKKNLMVSQMSEQNSIYDNTPRRDGASAINGYRGSNRATPIDPNNQDVYGTVTTEMAQLQRRLHEQKLQEIYSTKEAVLRQTPQIGETTPNHSVTPAPKVDRSNKPQRFNNMVVGGYQMRLTPQSANPNKFPNAESPQMQGLDSDYINTQQVVQQLQMHSRQSSLIEANLPMSNQSPHVVNESPYGTRMMMSRMPKKPIPPPPPRTPSKPLIGGPLPPPPGRASNQTQRVYEAMGRPIGSPMGALNNSMDRRTPADRDLMIKNAPPPYSAVNAIKQNNNGNYPIYGMSPGSTPPTRPSPMLDSQNYISRSGGKRTNLFAPSNNMSPANLNHNNNNNNNNNANNHNNMSSGGSNNMNSNLNGNKIEMNNNNQDYNDKQPGYQVNNGPYLNLPYSSYRGPGAPPPLPPPMSYPEATRGSAFELYKKPDLVGPPSGHSPAYKRSILTDVDDEYANLGDHPRERPDDPTPLNGNVVAYVQGVFNSQGGRLYSERTGVSLVIPEGAIPEGVQQEVYFKVCQDDSMLPPLDRGRGETLLSPLVMCGPHGLKFLKAIELRLPHCAALNPDHWSFALKSTDTAGGVPSEWQNVSLDNMKGVASSQIKDNHILVKVDHF